MMETTHVSNRPSHMLDVVLKKKSLKNDAALARAINVPAPVISKVRHDNLPIGASLLVRLHEFTGMSTRELKDLAGMPPV